MIAGCATCNADSTSCTAPAAGYRLTAAGGLHKCRLDNCGKCDGTADTCESCAVNYQLVNGKCVSAACGVVGCDSCQQGVCSQSDDGYRLGSGGAITKCTVANCEKCRDSADICTGCDDG